MQVHLRKEYGRRVGGSASYLFQLVIFTRRGNIVPEPAPNVSAGLKRETALDPHRVTVLSGACLRCPLWSANSLTSPLMSAEAREWVKEGALGAPPSLELLPSRPTQARVLLRSGLPADNSPESYVTARPVTGRHRTSNCGPQGSRELHRRTRGEHGGDQDGGAPRRTVPFHLIGVSANPRVWIVRSSRRSAGVAVRNRMTRPGCQAA